MTDDIPLNSGSGGPSVRAYSDGSVDYPAGLVAYPTGGSTGAWTLQVVDLTHGLPVVGQTGAAFPVTDNSGSLTVDNGGTFAVQAAQSGTWNIGTITTLTGITNAVAVTDNGGSLTVDGTVAVIGTFWQATQPVSIATAPVLVAGSAIIGKVGIDQTTPGTTNGVQVNAALPAGANTIGTVSITDISAAEYETVAASATDQALGATGATGDYLAGILIVPATTAAGAVSIKDGSGSAISLFAGGGVTALTTLIPFFVPLGIKSTGGAWKVTTGSNVSAIGVGNFT